VVPTFKLVFAQQEIIDCFSDSPDVLLDWLEGKWKGKEGVKEYFEVNQVPPVNFQHQLIPSAGLITVDPDGKKAKGRWYAFGGIMMPSQEIHILHSSKRGYC